MIGQPAIQPASQPASPSPATSLPLTAWPSWETLVLVSTHRRDGDEACLRRFRIGFFQIQIQLHNSHRIINSPRPKIFGPWSLLG